MLNRASRRRGRPRGPSALDWAILKGVRRWGVTVLQAEREMDAGPVWASADFPMRPAAKSSLYRNEVTEAAAAAVFEAISRFERGNFVPRRVAAASWQPAMHQGDRVINWASDDTGKVLRKIWSADGSPGLKSRLCGRVPAGRLPMAGTGSKRRTAISIWCEGLRPSL